MSFTRIYLLVLLCICSYGFTVPQDGGVPYFTPPPQINVEDHPKITITLEGQQKPIECTLDSIKKMYSCSKNKIIVKSNFMGFVALTKDKDNTAKLVTPTEVKNGDKILFAAPKFSGEFLGLGSTHASLPADLSTMLATEKMAINEFFQKPLKGELTKGSEAFEIIAAEYYKRNDEILKTANTILQEKNYEVELADGQKINCTRGNTRNLSEQDKKYEEMTGQKLSCTAFKCDEVKIDGKSYQASMLYNSALGSFGTNSIHLRNSEGKGPSAQVKTVRSPNSSLPLKDNSRFLDYAATSSPVGMSFMGFQTLPNALPDDIEKDKEMSLFRNSSFMSTVGEAENLCQEYFSAIENIKLSKYDAQKKLSETELVQLISIINGGALLGQYIDPNKAAQLGCYYGGLYLNEEAAKNLDKIKKNIYPDEHVDKTIDIDRAKQLFKKARAMTDIAWDYKPDGCYARAHLMARRFEAEGVRVDKVWIKGNLYVPEANISWNFHVAPIVYVKDKNGDIQKMVIDPSLFDEPVTVEEWDKKMTKQTMKKESSITAFPYPENSATVERASLAFSSSDPYLPGDNIDMSEESKIKMANSTMLEYKNIGADNNGIYNYPGMPQ